MILTNLYKQLKEKIIDKYGKYDEETLELDEKEYWVRRLVAQATRDIRMSGHINTGNQEALEQIGISILPLSKLIKEFLKTEDECGVYTINRLDVFLDECAKMFKDNCDEVLKRRGLLVGIEKKLLTNFSKD